MENILIACKKCSIKVPTNELISDEGNGDFICYQCYNNDNDPVLRTEKRQENLRKMAMESTKYSCVDCNYSFTKKTEFKGNCPYCGSSDGVKKVKSASTLIKEVGDEDYLQ